MLCSTKTHFSIELMLGGKLKGTFQNTLQKEEVNFEIEIQGHFF